MASPNHKNAFFITLSNVLLSAPHMFNNFMVNTEEEIGGQRQRHQFGDGESPPHVVYVSQPGQQICRRKQDDKLPGDRNYHTVHSVSKSLKNGSAYNTETGQQKTKTDRPQCRNTNAHHCFRSIEPLQ